MEMVLRAAPGDAPTSGGCAMTVPLSALLRRASRMAEQMFEETGQIDMFWLVERSNGEQEVIVSPMVLPPGTPANEAKLQLAEYLREFFREHDVVRYAHAAEAWTVQEDEPATGPLASHPQRREIVVLDADDGCECIVAMRDIIRPQHGKPYLAKMGTIERTERPTGRLMNLLNDVKPTSELADDEGTVFVTDVPGAPFQVLGRRGPTGELFVGSVLTASRKPINEQTCREFSTATAVKVEIVTGPEAERLIAGVKRRMGGMSPPTAH
jgi:hypothetical protein